MAVIVHACLASKNPAKVPATMVEVHETTTAIRSGSEAGEQ